MSALSPSCIEPARIGPNSVTQLGETLLAHGERALARQVYLRAGHPDWLASPPEEMIAEQDAARVHAALSDLVDPDRACAFVREAGMRTGDYILANRIPKTARMLLRLMPAPIAAKLLVEAISSHAWTFAGSGRFRYELSRPVLLEIADNPLADQHGCVWHAAVFQRLFQSLVRAETSVREIACSRSGAAVCRFAVDWPRGH